MYSNKYLKRRLKNIEKNRYKEMFAVIAIIGMVLVLQILNDGFNLYSAMILLGICVYILNDIEKIKLIEYIQKNNENRLQ